MEEVLKLTGNPSWAGAITRKLKSENAEEFKQLFNTQIKPLLNQNLEQNIETLTQVIKQLGKNLEHKHDFNWYLNYANPCFGLLDTIVNTGYVTNQLIEELTKEAEKRNTTLEKLLMQLDSTLDSDVGKLLQAIENLPAGQKQQIKQLEGNEKQLETEIKQTLGEKFEEIKKLSESITPATLIVQTLKSIQHKTIPKQKVTYGETVRNYHRLKTLQNQTHYLGIKIERQMEAKQ